MDMGTHTRCLPPAAAAAQAERFPATINQPRFCHACLPSPPACAAVTWDDGISPFSYGLVQQIVGGLKQRNDCPIPSTFYICVTGALRCGCTACAHGAAAAAVLRSA